MPTAIEMRQKRANLWEQMKALHDRAKAENRDLTAEERQQWDRIDGEINSLKAQIDREERVANLGAELGQKDERVAGGREPIEPAATSTGSGYSEEDRKAAFEAYLRRGFGGMTPEQRGYVQSRYQALPPEARALASGTDASGGYAVEDEFVRRVETSMLAFGGMREVATPINTETGADLLIPTADDTAQKGAILSENTQASEQDITFAQLTIASYMYTSKLIRVSFQLLQDAAFPIESWLAERLGERLGRITNEHFTTGTGTAQPHGVVTGASSAVTAASATTVTSDELLDLIHGVDPAYRRNGRFMFNDGTLKKLKQLKDGEGRPLWLPGLAVREPDTLLGFPYTINQDVAAMATAAKPILYGDFSKYWVRNVRGFTLLRLTERYADYLQVGFLAFSRHGGRLVDSGTDPVKFITMA